MLVACPVGAGDRVLALGESGAAVINAGPTFEVVGTGRLDDTFWAAPAVAGGNLYLRGVDHLYCFRTSNKERGSSLDHGRRGAGPPLIR